MEIRWWCCARAFVVVAFESAIFFMFTNFVFFFPFNVNRSSRGEVIFQLVSSSCGMNDGSDLFYQYFLVSRFQVALDSHTLAYDPIAWSHNSKKKKRKRLIIYIIASIPIVTVRSPKQMNYDFYCRKIFRNNAWLGVTSFSPSLSHT